MMIRRRYYYDKGLADIDTNLVAKYELSSDGLDSSGNNYHGAITGVLPQTDGVCGEANGALHFDVNNFITLPDIPTIDLTAGFSISVWLRRNDIAKLDQHYFPSLVMLKIGGIAGNGLVLDLNRVVLLRNNVSYYPFMGGNTFGNYEHYYGFISNSSMNCAYQGGIINPNGGNEGGAWGLNKSYIGNGWTTKHLIGDVCKVRIYKGALTQKQINSIVIYKR